jgi:hypothetical protein
VVQTRKEGQAVHTQSGSWALDVIGGVRVVVHDEVAELALDGEFSEARESELREGPLRAVRCVLSGGAALHGSAVGFDGFGVAFLGFTGQGKSTLTSELVRQGSSLVSDGLVCVDADGLLLVGQQRIKLREPSLRIHGLEPEAHEPVHELSDKRIVYPDLPPIEEALPLRCAFVLEVGEKAEIKTLGPAQRLKLLVLHSYLVTAFPVSVQSTILGHVAMLARQCDVVRLVRSERAEELPALVELVRTHIQHIGRSQGLEFNA